MAQPASDQASYAAAWARYRRIRLLTILLLVTLPIGPGLGAALPFGQEVASVLLFALWIVAIVVAATKWTYFPCPRCGKRFQRKAGWHTHTCASCGLVKFAETEAEAAPKAYPEQQELAAASADATYVEAWKKYHHLQLMRSPWILAGALLVAGVVVPQVARLDSTGIVPSIVTGVWGLSWFLVYATSRVRLRAFRCPRCKHRFHGGVDITKAEWCNHCRLRLYALGDPDAKNALR